MGATTETADTIIRRCDLAAQRISGSEILQGEVRRLCGLLEQFQNPPAACYQAKVGDSTVHVDGVFVEGDRSTGVRGTFGVLGVYVRGENITDILSNAQIDDIRAQCAEQCREAA